MVSTDQQYRMAIVGSPDVVQGFSALGVDTFPVRKDVEVHEALKRTKDEGRYAVVFITEDWADQSQEVLADLSTDALPAYIAIPPPHGSTGAGMKRLQQIVEQAVGSDILSSS